MSESYGMADLIVAKSNQLNADDLVNGPVNAQIMSAKIVKGEQPLSLGLSGGLRVWKPCKTSMRLLVAGWGLDEQKYVGKWITLYRDPDAIYGGVAVGGIRHSAMSDIASGFTLKLAYARGKKTEYRISILTPPTQGKPTVDPAFAAFGAALVAATKNGWTNEQVKALLGCPAAEVPVDRRAEIVATLANPPANEGGES